jgi:hypothetical protein
VLRPRIPNLAWCARSPAAWCASSAARSPATWCARALAVDLVRRALVVDLVRELGRALAGDRRRRDCERAVALVAGDVAASVRVRCDGLGSQPPSCVDLR